MLHNFGKRLLITGVFLSGFLFASAQNSNKENAPYSRYGIGETRNGVNTLLKGMGSISSAYAHPFAVNTDNPASYSFLKLTTYELGAEASSRTIISGNQSIPTGTATISYLNIGVPVGKNGGLVLGLKPFTRVYYNIADTTNIPNIGPSVISYSGDGSTNFAFIGGAYNYQGFSLGFNFGYLFGTTRNSSLLIANSDTASAYNADFSRYTKVGGVYSKFGAMYQGKLKENLEICIGGTATLKQNLNASRDDYQVAFRTGGGVTTYDTSIGTKGVAGKVELPFSYSFGVQLLSGIKWAAGFDFTSTNWSQYRSFGAVDSLTDRTFRIAIGGEYTPSTETRTGYLSRVTYRIGGYYGKDPVRIRNTTQNYYAFTAGASLPFKRSPDRVHLGLEIGRRGQEINGLFRENFFRFSAGISLNDKWFVKRKYE